MRAADIIEVALAKRMDDRHLLPFVLGICGAQGSGKSTIAAEIARRCRERGLRCAELSLDDLYLDGARRAELASVHPLLRTRGVPGTHNVALGIELITALGRDGVVQLPRFDKGQDEPVPKDDWPRFEGPADILILEGWCVGALPQDDDRLRQPVNILEETQDSQGIWRTYANSQLAGLYRCLFERINMLVMLKAPSFDVVAGWRIEQERGLRNACAKSGETLRANMSDHQIRDFVLLYQRITEHMLGMPNDWVDLMLHLSPERELMGFSEL